MKKPVKKTAVEFQGWVLITKDQGAAHWHIAWLDVFYRKKDAVAFAVEASWSQPYRAVRGRIVADPVHANQGAGR